MGQREVELRKEAWQSVLRSPLGRLVMREICDRWRDESDFDKDPILMAYKCGRRDIATQTLAIMRSIDPEIDIKMAHDRNVELQSKSTGKPAEQE